MPFAWAFFAIAPSLPCEERLMYQIHIPSPASGLFAAGVSLVCDEAPPAKGPAAIATSAAAAIRARVVVRRRARMNSRLRTPKHALARKGACLCRGRGWELLVGVVGAADQRPGRHRRESQLVGGLLQRRELIWVPVAIHREVL